jgi:hypothetical protein
VFLGVGMAACGPNASKSQGTSSNQAAGDVAAPVDNTPAAPLRDGERFERLAMPRAYTPVAPPGGPHQYQCFLEQPHLEQDAYVTGSQFLPQNAKVVHHAILFRIPAGSVADAQKLDAKDPGDGWTCFGGTGIRGGGTPGQQTRSGEAWIAAWAPGAKETLLADHLGYQMPAGSQIIMQIHYNLLATDGKPQPDRSGVRLRLADGSKKLTALQTALVPAPVELPCPRGVTGKLCDRQKSVNDVFSRFGPRAGATVAGLNFICNGGRDPKPGPKQHCDIPIREAGTVYAVAGHMHLLGRTIKVELNPGTSRARVLLDNRNYNFDDQSARSLAKPVTIKPGDTFRVTCTHDASLRQKLPELSQLPPRYVVWGDGSSDEMCLGVVVWAPSA